MTDQIEDTVTFNDKLTDIKDYWDLFQTTGWNQKYNFSIQDLAKAIKSSWYSTLNYDSDILIGFGLVIADGYKML